MNFDTFVNPTTISTVLIMTVISAAVSSMPPPKTDSSEWYKWLYKFLNTVMANVSALRGKAQFEEGMHVETVTAATTVSKSVGTTETPKENQDAIAH